MKISKLKEALRYLSLVAKYAEKGHLNQYAMDNGDVVMILNAIRTVRAELPEFEAEFRKELAKEIKARKDSAADFETLVTAIV